MKNLKLILLVLMAFKAVVISAMEPADTKDSSVQPSGQKESEKSGRRQMKLVKIWSKSQGDSTVWEGVVHERNKETISTLKNRFSGLKNAVSYSYSPLELLQRIDNKPKENFQEWLDNLSEADKDLYFAQENFAKKSRGAVSSSELTQAIDEFAFNRKTLYSKYKWVASEKYGEKVCRPEENFFHVREELLDAKGQLLSSSELDEKNKKNEKIFIQKKLFPLDATIHLLPDIHGDIKKSIKVLEAYVKQGIISDDLCVNKKHAIICLGDYVDEGIYSTEVLYTLLCLANLNPDNVFLGRGQHEHAAENKCLLSELEKKFDKEKNKSKKEKNDLKRLPSEQLFQKIHFFYRLLPAAFFIGKKDNWGKNYIDFICASHAGLEIGYQGYDQLLGHDSNDACQWLVINRSQQIDKLPLSIKDEIKTLAKDGFHASLAAEINNKNKVIVTDIRKIKSGEANYNLGFCHDNYQLEPDKGVGYNENQKVWCWSKKLTDGIFKLWNNKSWYRTTLMLLNWPLRKLFGWGLNSPTYSVIGNIRGHQQSYDYKRQNDAQFMKKLIGGKGIFNLWNDNDNNKEIPNTITMTPGTVATLLCLGADNQYTFPYKVMHKKQPRKNNRGGDMYFVPYTFATIAKLTFNAAISRWCIERNNVPIFNRYDLQAFGMETKDSIIGIESLN